MKNYQSITLKALAGLLFFGSCYAGDLLREVMVVDPSGQNIALSWLIQQFENDLKKMKQIVESGIYSAAQFRLSIGMSKAETLKDMMASKVTDEKGKINFYQYRADDLMQHIDEKIKVTENPRDKKRLEDVKSNMQEKLAKAVDVIRRTYKAYTPAMAIEKYIQWDKKNYPSKYI